MEKDDCIVFSVASDKISALVCYQKRGKNLVAIASDDNTIQAVTCDVRLVLVTATHTFQSSCFSFPCRFLPLPHPIYLFPHTPFTFQQGSPDGLLLPFRACINYLAVNNSHSLGNPGKAVTLHNHETQVYCL